MSLARVRKALWARREKGSDDEESLAESSEGSGSKEAVSTGGKHRKLTKIHFKLPGKPGQRGVTEMAAWLSEKAGVEAPGGSTSFGGDVSFDDLHPQPDGASDLGDGTSDEDSLHGDRPPLPGDLLGLRGRSRAEDESLKDQPCGWKWDPHPVDGVVPAGGSLHDG